MRASVVLPDPFGPSSATISPRRTSRSTPSSTGNRLAVGERDLAQRERDLAGGALCFRNTRPRPARALRRQPLDRLGARGVEDEAAAVDEEDTRRELERARDAVLGENDRRAEPLDGVEEERGRGRVELRRRLVEQQQLRLERERRGEAHPLQLAAGQLDRLSPPEVQRVDRLERALDARPDLGGRDAEVLEPEGDLVRDDRHHDLVLRILEDRRDGPGKRGRPRRTRVEAGDDDSAGEAAAVEVRHEPCERAQQGRLSGARWAEQRHNLAGLELERDVLQRRGWHRDRRTRGRRPTLEPQRRHQDEESGGRECEPVACGPRRPRRPRRARPTEPARLHRLREARRALERPGDERREQGRVARALLRAARLSPAPTPQARPHRARARARAGSRARRRAPSAAPFPPPPRAGRDRGGARTRRTRARAPPAAGRSAPPRRSRSS